MVLECVNIDSTFNHSRHVNAFTILERSMYHHHSSLTVETKEFSKMSQHTLVVNTREISIPQETEETFHR